METYIKFDLNQLLSDYGIRQSELARFLNISRQAVWNWCNGITPSIMRQEQIKNNLIIIKEKEQ